jgi:N-acetylglucosaminyldiphosphoundecaprenol N-acetyl-beta-D-mannosaminyltransferase
MAATRITGMSDETRDKSQRDRERAAFYQRYTKTALRRQRIRRWFRSMSLGLVVRLVSWGKRLFDLTVALFLVVILSPLLILGFLLSGLSFRRTPRLGQWCMVFDELAFRTDHGLQGTIVEKLHLQRLPVLFNILNGDMSFVGPLPVSPGDLSPRERQVRKRHRVRPGLISLWWIRRRANIDYGTELEADSEYVDAQGIWGDIGISLRAIPAILYGEAVATAPDELTMLGITIDNVTMADAVDTILEWVQEPQSRQVCFVNADCANIAYRDSEYLKVLQTADFCLADGIGLKLGGKVLGRAIKQNVNGTDLFPKVCERLSGTESGIFLLGARPEVVEGVANWIGEHFPLVSVCGRHHGYFQPDQEEAVIEMIKNSGAHILLVAFGAPRQDQWIHEHLDDTGVRVAMGVGGLFDFYSGRMPRAPQWVREIGMEWLFRLVQEPGRLWKRYIIGNGLFLFRVFRERLRPGQ